MRKNSNTSVCTVLDQFCKQQEWESYDPYDGLTSKLLQGRKRSRLARLAIVQLNRLSPINLRRLLAIEKRLDLKAVALFAKASLRFCRTIETNKRPQFKAQAEHCLNILQTHRCPHSRDYSIGTNRPIQMASYYIDADEPCPFITLLAGESFLEAYKALASQHWLDLAVSTAGYFTDELMRTEHSAEEVYFHYMPKMEKEIYNLNALIGNFLVKVSHVTKNDKFFDLGRKAIIYTVNRQHENGSWFYSEEAKYIDNYHTGFMLLSLIESNEILGSPAIEQSIQLGVQFYLDHLIIQKGEDVMPVHFYRRHLPLNSNIITKVDIRDCAMAIVLFSKLSTIDSRYAVLADKTLNWTLEKMRDKDGFYHEQTWLWRNKIKYLSLQAYMLYALSVYQSYAD
jgi:hypothetical protein